MGLYHWQAKYGGLDKSEAQRLKELEQENTRLKKLLAETMLANDVIWIHYYVVKVIVVVHNMGRNRPNSSLIKKLIEFPAGLSIRLTELIWKRPINAQRLDYKLSEELSPASRKFTKYRISRVINSSLSYIRKTGGL